jgi:hypothetical protein
MDFHNNLIIIILQIQAPIKINHKKIQNYKTTNNKVKLILGILIHLISIISNLLRSKKRECVN